MKLCIRYLATLLAAALLGPLATRRAQINQSLNSQDLKTRFNAAGAVAAPTMPQAFGAHIAREIARWQPVVAVGWAQGYSRSLHRLLHIDLGDAAAAACIG